jgi:hypothetical protein
MAFEIALPGHGHFFRWTYHENQVISMGNRQELDLMAKQFDRLRADLFEQARMIHEKEQPLLFEVTAWVFIISRLIVGYDIHAAALDHLHHQRRPGSRQPSNDREFQSRKTLGSEAI